MASLRIISGMNAGQAFELDGAESIIGREPWCKVRLNSRTVSRSHACISQQPDGYFIEDLHSVNGTSVNGRRVERLTRLDHGDHIQIFDIELLFQMQAGGTVTAAVVDNAAPLTTVDPQNGSNIVSQIDVHVHGDEMRTTESEKKLSAMLRIAHSLGTSLAVDDILVRILDSLFDLFPNAQMGYILQAANGGELSLTVVKSRGDASDTLSPISLRIARRVMTEGLAFLTASAVASGENAPSSIFDEDVRSIMCAPLIGPSRTAMGVIELVSTELENPFIPADLEVLSTVALLAGQAVENARLHESLLELDGRRREIAMAKSVQLHFLPNETPTIPSYTFFHHYAAADSVAGDYFDYIPLPDGRWGVAVGDVSGKGISAALLMARLCSDVRFCLLTNPSPAEALNKLNRQVWSHVQGDSFVTLVLFLLDPVAHELTFVNAGHPLPLLKNADGRCSNIMVLEEVSLPLGVDPDTIYTQHTMSLKAGDLVLAYTDGVSDANNPEGELYGVQPIEDVVSSTKGVPAFVGRALLASVREFAKGRPQSDDICIVSFGRKANCICE